MAATSDPAVSIFVDGSSRGNPGPAGVGVAVFKAGEKEACAEISKYIGVTTNNVAEYEAVIHALKWMIESGTPSACVKLDSELVYRQLTGKYRIKKPHIRLLMKRLTQLRSQINDVTFTIIPREENRSANRLAQRASKKTAPKQQRFEQTRLPQAEE